MSDLYLVLRSRISAVAEWVELGSDVMTAAREGRGLSREAVARQLHVSTKTVERHEKDGRIPRHLVANYADIVGLEIEEPARERVTLDRGDDHLSPDLRVKLSAAVDQFAQVGPQLVAVARQLTEALAANEESQAQTRGLVADLLAALRAAEEDRKRRRPD